MNLILTLIAKLSRQTQQLHRRQKPVKRVCRYKQTPILPVNHPIYTSMTKTLNGACSMFYFIHILVMQELRPAFKFSKPSATDAFWTLKVRVQRKCNQIFDLKQCALCKHHSFGIMCKYHSFGQHSENSDCPLRTEKLCQL
jgi:hypothetical protein